MATEAARTGLDDGEAGEVGDSVRLLYIHGSGRRPFRPFLLRESRDEATPLRYNQSIPDMVKGSHKPVNRYVE